MNEYVKNAILFDLYGGLLSKKEQKAYKLRVYDDLSFQEIGDELKTSRQAAHELFKNADKRLIDIEKKLHLSKKIKIENKEEKTKW